MAENNTVGRFVDAGEEPVETLTPIAGYETVDLVSLEDAVKPLEPLLHNLNAMVQTAKRNSRKPADGLTPDESAAIHLYTMQWPNPYTSIYTLLNQRLRSQDRDTLVPWYLYLKLFLTALYKLPPVNNRIVWRGIRGNVSDQYDEDQIWWGISSCTETIKVMQKFVGRDGVRTLFSIECISGKAIRAHSHYTAENEILLLPGTYLKVVDKWSPSQDLFIIHLREMIAPYQTITPPIDPCIPLVETPSLANLVICNEMDNISSDIQASEQSSISVSSETPVTTSKPKRTSIATVLPQHQNPILENIIANNSNSLELKLVLMDLTDEDMEIVAHYALQNIKTLNVLNISSNDIGDKGAQYLSDELRKNTTLTKLYLYNNRIGAKGVQYLSEALKNNTTLKSLNLSSNQIGDEGVQYLSDALQNNVTLTELYLSFNQIGEEGAKYLSNLLKNESTLIVLNLSSNEIGNNGTQYLSDSLQNNKTLYQLDLSSNEIGDIGIQYLSDILRNNITLHILNLRNNQFRCKGMEYLHNALQNNTTLITLDLSSNQFEEQGLEYLAELRRKNTKLNVSW